MEPKKRISIAGYIRVSRLKQAKMGSSLPEQRREIETYARAHGYKIHQIYADGGVSGALSDRPALMRMKADARNALFQKVVFTYLDRFGRSATDTLANYTYFEELGITLHSIREGLDTGTYLGRFIRTILAGAAEMERERIGERLACGIAARLQKGLGFKPYPFGYIWNEEKGKLEYHPDQKNTYERIVDDYLIRNKSASRIAASLNLSGVKSVKGKKWTCTSIIYILKNPTYKGRISHNFLGKKYDLEFPALIEADRWDKIQRRMAERRIPRFASVPENDPYILRNLVQCGECGYAIFPYSIKSKGKIRRYYVCRLGHMNPALRLIANTNKTCFLPSIKAKELEDVVLNGIQEFLTRPASVLQLHEPPSAAMGGTHGKIGKYYSDLGHLETKRDAIWDLFNEGVIGKEELIRGDNAIKDLINELKREIIRLKEERALFKARKKEFDEMTESEAAQKELCKKIKEAIEGFSTNELRGLLRAALGGARLKVRIIRRRDLSEGEEGRSTEAMDEPVADPNRRVRNGYLWMVEGTDALDMKAAGQYLRAVKGIAMLPNQYIS